MSRGNWQRAAIVSGVLLLTLIAACRTQVAPRSIYTPPSQSQQVELPPSDPAAVDGWTESQLRLLRSLWIGSLPLPPDPNDPATAIERAALGHRLFFDARFSANNQIACATCHIPQRAFTDALPTAHGARPNPRNTLSVIGSAYAPLLLWDGRKDSLWAQALAPIEAPDEHGATRLQAIHLLNRDADYRLAYTAIFGPLPPLDDFARFPDAGGPVDFLDYRQRWETMTPQDQAAATEV